MAFQALEVLILLVVAAQSTHAITVPQTAPSNASTVDPSLLSVSIEFFAFPGYTDLSATSTCLANIASLRGAHPAVRIGGTTQDRATYDPNLSSAVNYSVASPADAPASLTYGPSFFDLAADLSGDVTIGFNRQLNEISNVGAAAAEAQDTMSNLYAIELGNEPDLYGSGSPIIPSSGGWTPTTDGQSQKEWETDLAPSVGNIFQAAVYISFPTWSTQGLIPILGSAIDFVKTFSIHSYPQSACGGASTDLNSLMSHSGIASYTSRFKPDAVAAHGQGKQFFLGETNSATCGGGGISPTFGAGLWIVDYVLQAALNGVDRLYFHQGTIGNCAYCFWNTTVINAPYYGAYFVSQFLGTDGASISELSTDSSAVVVYAVYSSSNTLLRTLIYNSNYFDGTGTRSNQTVQLSGLSSSLSKATAVRLTAKAAGVIIGQGGAEVGAVTIGGGLTFGSGCEVSGEQTGESVVVSGGVANVVVQESEAVIVDFTG